PNEMTVTFNAGVATRHNRPDNAESAKKVHFSRELPSSKLSVYEDKLQFFFSSRRRHTRSVSAFLLNRSSDLISETCCCLERLVFSIIDATRAVDSFC